jgi:hypothetical protein
LFTELPPAIEQRPLPDRTISPERRRLAVENRTFTVTQATQSVIGSNKKIVEAGQILEFEDDIILEVDPLLVTPINETQHNTNKLDFESLGISTADQAEIVDSANKLFKELNIELNQILIDRKNTEIAIVEVKKLQNENRKTTDAIQVLVDNGQADLQSVIDDLNVQLDELVQQEQQLVTLANELTAQATAKRDTIRDVAEVVR